MAGQAARVRTARRGGFGIGYTRVPFGQYVSINNTPFVSSVNLINGTLTDPAAGPADTRMAAYFKGQHHPQQALLPRVGYVALADDGVVGVPSHAVSAAAATISRAARFMRHLGIRDSKPLDLTADDETCPGDGDRQ